MTRRSLLKGTIVNSIKDIEAQIAAASEMLELQPDEELWFRGVADARYQLLPSLIRALPLRTR
jgi:hypothetical protein